jgi:hypothetical protein
LCKKRIGPATSFSNIFSFVFTVKFHVTSGSSFGGPVPGLRSWGFLGEGWPWLIWVVKCSCAAHLVFATERSFPYLRFSYNDSLWQLIIQIRLLFYDWTIVCGESQKLRGVGSTQIDRWMDKKERYTDIKNRKKFRKNG